MPVSRVGESWVSGRAKVIMIHRSKAVGLGVWGCGKTNGGNGFEKRGFRRGSLGRETQIKMNGKIII